MSSENVDDEINDNETELSSSKLGTLEYWESAYEKEIENYEGYGDEGEIWFGIQTVKRVINWLKKQELDKLNTSFVDIGCGNGFTCCRLAEEGFKKVVGIDYSGKAIELAKSIAESKNLEIVYNVVDVLDENKFGQLGTFDFGIDKGTYDAIALNPTDPKIKRHLYKTFLASLLHSNSSFIITSCNWTRDELIEFFTKDKEFEFVDEIKSADQPKFSFGGKSGATTTTLILKRI